MTSTSSTPSPGTAGNAKFFVTAGAFSAIYFVLLFGTGTVGFAGPAFMFVGWLLGILLNGTVIALYLAKTRRMGAMAILGAVVGVMMLVMGDVWLVVVFTPLLGLAADLLTRAGRLRSRIMDSWAYAVFSLWLVSPLVPIFYAADRYFADIETMMGADYTRGMKELFTAPVLIGWAVVILVVAWVSAWLGTRLVAKHFAKAGVA